MSQNTQYENHKSGQSYTFKRELAFPLFSIQLETRYGEGKALVSLLALSPLETALGVGEMFVLSSSTIMPSQVCEARERLNAPHIISSYENAMRELSNLPVQQILGTYFLCLCATITNAKNNRTAPQ